MSWAVRAHPRAPRAMARAHGPAIWWAAIGGALWAEWNGIVGAFFSTMSLLCYLYTALLGPFSSAVSLPPGWYGSALVGQGLSRAHRHVILGPLAHLADLLEEIVQVFLPGDEIDRKSTRLNSS